MLDVARKVLGVLLLAGCSIDVAGALEPQRSTEQSLSARNDELSLSLTVREVRAEGLVLEGRVNTELDGARAFVPDDEIGVTTLSTRGFTTVLPLAEVAARLSGSPLLIGVHTRAGAQHFARVSLALTLPSSCKVPGVSFDRPFSSVLLDGVPMVRLRGHATTPGLRSHAWLGGSEEAPRWKGRRAGQLFWLDLPLDMMTSALLAPAQLHVSFDTGDRERAKTCTPSVTVRALELTEDDPYDVWPAPSCSGALAQCLARDVHTHDTSACGEPYVVQACGPRPLPAACGIKQAKKLAHTMEGTLWMSETDAPFEPVSFAAQAEESASEVLRRALRLELETPVETRKLDDVLAWPSQDRQGDVPADRLRAATYRTLYRQLSAWLDDVVVVRVGSVSIDVYFVGRDACGNLVGLKTLAVET